MKRAILVALTITLVAMASFTGTAMRRDLAVTYVTTWKETSMTSRFFYQGNDKVRFESENDGGTIVKTGSTEVVGGTKQTGVQIMRYDLGVYWTLDVGNHTCLEAPLPPSPSSPANPQPSFTKLPRVGEETVLGYVCDIYRTETGNPQTYWYTPNWESCFDWRPDQVRRSPS